MTHHVLDPVLNQLVATIIAGWPVDGTDLPPDIRSFWRFRDQLFVENDLILKGQQPVIPRMRQPEILRQLHTAQHGTEKTKLLARCTGCTLTNSVRQAVVAAHYDVSIRQAATAIFVTENIF